jgi:hypothetical protein
MLSEKREYGMSKQEKPPQRKLCEGKEGLVENI